MAVVATNRSDRLKIDFEKKKEDLQVYDIEANPLCELWISRKDATQMLVPQYYKSFKAFHSHINKKADRHYFRNKETGKREVYFRRRDIDENIIRFSNKSVFVKNMIDNKALYNTNTKEFKDLKGVSVDKLSSTLDQWFDEYNVLTEKRTEHYVEESLIDGVENTIMPLSVQKEVPYQSYRMFYGLFMFKSFVDKAFRKMHGLTVWQLDLLIHINMFRMFSFNELYHFINTYTSMTQMSSFLKDGGWVEFRSKKGLRSNIIRDQRDNAKLIYTVTKKSSDLFQEYLDYMLFRKKLPRIRHDSKTLNLMPYNREKVIADNLYENRNDTIVNHDRRYLLYSFFFEYVNENTEITNPLGFDEKEIQRALTESSIDYKFSAFYYLKANHFYSKSEDYLSRKSTHKVMEAYLKRNVFSEIYSPPSESMDDTDDDID